MEGSTPSADSLSALLAAENVLEGMDPERRRRIEREVARLELVDRLNTEQAPHVFVLLKRDADRTIVYEDLNQTAARYLSMATGRELTREELVGKNSGRLGLHSFNGQLDPLYEEVLESGVPQSHVACLSTPAGDRYFHNEISPVRINGEPRAAVHAYDITEQLKAGEGENIFRMLVEHSRDIIALMDLTDRRIIYQSPSITEILGHEHGQELDQVLQWADPQDLPEIYERIEILATDPSSTPEPLEIRARHVDGTYRILETRGSVVEEEGKRRWLIVNARDITEQRHLEEKLRQSQKMEAVGRLAGGVAHDFNNLLTVIGGEAELLYEEQPGSEGIQEILSSTERASKLTRQLLAFSRKQVLHPEVVDINGVVAGMQKMLGRLIGEDVTIKTDLQYKPWTVKADVNQLEQVIMNLATNARDAMPRGGTLEIVTRNVTLHGIDAGSLSPGPYVELRMTDSGVGMSEQDLAHVFEPFYTTKEEGRGTGLGLSTVYGIVTQSEGDVRVSSVQGAGTSFRIYLPRCQENVSPQEHHEPGAASENEGLVLLVEDEKSVLNLADRVLRRAGYAVISAMDGDEARDVVSTLGEHLSVVISDIVMPNASGTELSQYVHEQHPELPVVLMTGYSRDFLPDVSRGHLRETVLEKPWTPKQLVETVGYALSGR